MNIKNVKPLALSLSLVMNSMLINLIGTSEVQANELAVATQSIEHASLDAKNTLMAKLAHLDFFSANFSQKVLSESGEVLEQSAGKLAISKPNLANWHTVEPDETAIVSDGQDVWFYNPWIEQVSVFSLSAAIAQTPILLLTSKDQSLWQQYIVTKVNVTKKNLTQKELLQNEESFVISAKDVNSQIKSLTLIFDSQMNGGQLKQFSFLDATGQLSHIRLSDFDDQHMPSLSLFNFVLPEGVQIDDQRSN